MDSKVRRIAIVGSAVALAGAGIFLATQAGTDDSPTKKKKKESDGISTPVVRKPRSLEKPTGPVALTSATALRIPTRPIDRDVEEAINKSFEEATMYKADVFPGGVVSVTLQKASHDAGVPVIRAILDLNRDGQADETWNVLRDGSILRTATIKSYRDTWRKVEDTWVLQEGMAATMFLQPIKRAAPEESPLRDIDKRLLELADRDLVAPRVTDNLGGAKVVLTRPAKGKRANRVDIDLDGDGVNDEHWVLADQVTRMVSTPKAGEEGAPKAAFRLSVDRAHWVKLQ